jgi:signal-transduction protein with cAMP-binding, CBS, and nucleotidyltransferase domain
MTDAGPSIADGTGDLAGSLTASPPFNALTLDRVQEVARATQVERFAAGATILRQGGPPSPALYMVRSGHVEIRESGRLVDQPGVGEVFGELSLLTGAPPTATVVAGDDLVCLAVGGDVAREVLGTAGGVGFVQSSLRRGVLRSLDRDARSLATTIESADNQEAAVAAAREIPDLACVLLDDGADAVKIGHVISSSIDALTRRLLEFEIDDLGEPPVPWAWMALGSEARLEQALHTDQDHALAYELGDRPVEEVDPYFAQLAERVTTGIEAAGIPRCNGDAMAITPGLRRSVGSWATAFHDWMTDAGREGSIFSSITFDHRRVSGPLDIEPRLHAVIGQAADRYPDFLRHLSHRALDRKPPTGFIRNFVVESKGEHAGRLDIKHGGVTIIANLARVFAIRSGRPEMTTLDRLRAAEETGQINHENRQALAEAFRLLWQIRLEHQVRQVRASTEPDDFVDPAELGPIVRLGLKESFRIIGSEQQGLATQIGARY